MSLKKLFRAASDIIVDTLFADQHIVSVLPDDSPEYAVHLSVRHRLASIPVVDKNNVFLGVVPAENIISVIHEKHADYRAARTGVHRSHAGFDAFLDVSVLDSVKHRILWLLIGLCGGLVAAKVISGFEMTIEKNLILATFIPLVVYIADAVRTQLEAFAIRDFAVFRRIDFFAYFAKQASVVFIISLIMGIVTSLLSLLLYNNLNLSIILGAAIIAACISSVLTGLIVPIVFMKMNRDPADASGPIGTIIQDILSVFIYFLIASAVL